MPFAQEIPDPQCKFAVVSRYAAFPDLARRMGLVCGDVVSFSRPHSEEIRGHHVICDHIDLEAAAQASAVTVVPLNLPEDLRALDVSVATLARFVGKPQTYIVRGSSAAVLGQYDGGTTPSASLIAQSLIKHFRLETVKADDMAERLDALLFDERHAGSETEKLLIRMLRALRERNGFLETQLLIGAGKAMAAAG